MKPYSERDQLFEHMSEDEWLIREAHMSLTGGGYQRIANYSSVSAEQVQAVIQRETGKVIALDVIEEEINPELFLYDCYIFDIDGTLHKTKSGGPFRETADDYEWMPGRLATLKKIKGAGKTIAFCTNQRGVCFPWSKFTRDQIQAVLEACAAEIGAVLLKVSYASTNKKALPEFYVEVDERSKPAGTMVEEIIRETGISKEDTLFIGDREEDEQCARAAGVAFMHAEEFFA